jgi:predicted ArsR family transcriptional regulator
MSNVLMHRTRSRMIRLLLRRGPTTSKDLASELQTSLATVQHHLAMMRNFGLVETLPSHRHIVRTDRIQKLHMEIAAGFLVVMPPEHPFEMKE